MIDGLGHPYVRLLENGVHVESRAPGPYREGPAWIWLEKEAAADLAERLAALDLRSPEEDPAGDDLFTCDAFSAMRFRRYDEWWVQVHAGWNGQPNHGSVQFRGDEAAKLAADLRAVLDSVAEKG